ncbi:uncharacterized protein Dwil_GK28039 [Drosophila willistoni]|uniref:Uncharacterized protein n=1 Tax=Drosophila willistoni TaxID=7260 RepID=A0A0Q9WZP6_DROWI|nr:uncharacterized protein Dwil_GK28039 [Drosophila willistoni]
MMKSAAKATATATEAAAALAATTATATAVLPLFFPPMSVLSACQPASLPAYAAYA